MTAGELHVNATYAPTSALKSVYGKIQSMIGSKLFSSKDSVWTSTGSSRFQAKWLTWIALGSFHTKWCKFLRLGHGPSQNLIQICQVVTIYKIILNISAEYFVWIWRNCSSNKCQTENSKIGIQSKCIWFLELYISKYANLEQAQYFTGWNFSRNAGFDNSGTWRTYVCLLLLAYAWFWTCVRWHVRSFFSLWFFKVFKIFLVLIILYCLKTYCYIFDL